MIDQDLKYFLAVNTVGLQQAFITRVPLLHDGNAKCWGNGRHGQLGYGERIVGVQQLM